MKVPSFLSHLRTDSIGRPVPYINLWGPEDVQRMSIRHDPHVGMPGLFLDDSDQAEPDFFRQNMQRQRECMAAGLCQVCGRPVPWSRRRLVVSSISVQHIVLQGWPTIVLTEPWLDERCATFAAERCPGLIRRRRQDNFRVIPVTSPRRCQLTVSTGWVDGPLEEQSKKTQPAMWAKVLLGGPKTVTAADTLPRASALATRAGGS
jgi:hypothetical protein